MGSFPVVRQCQACKCALFHRAVALLEPLPTWKAKNEEENEKNFRKGKKLEKLQENEERFSMFLSCPPRSDMYRLWPCSQEVSDGGCAPPPKLVDFGICEIEFVQFGEHF